jgi:hypothetical protein
MTCATWNGYWFVYWLMNPFLARGNSKRSEAKRGNWTHLWSQAGQTGCGFADGRVHLEEAGRHRQTIKPRKVSDVEWKMEYNKGYG